MEIDLALLADAATIDAAGKLNILGVFDRISVSKFPAPHPHVSLVLRFKASLHEGGSHKVEIVLNDPDGNEVIRESRNLPFGPMGGMGGGQVRIPFVLNINRLVFPKPGGYSFQVFLDEEHKISLPLTVHGTRPGIVAGGRPPADA